MENLALTEMENIEGGNCATSAIALGLSVGAVGVLGATTAGAGFFAAGFILGSINLAHACE